MLLHSFKPRSAPDCKLGGPIADRDILRSEAVRRDSIRKHQHKKAFHIAPSTNSGSLSQGDAVMLNLKNYFCVPGVTKPQALR